MADQAISRPRLTVAAIVRDAEQTLAGTLESVREIADEIIVCDTGSTDATVQIAAPIATKVLDFPWTDDFSAARNACLEHVTGDWLLWLDAGERLEPDNAAGLREFIDAGPDQSNAYLLLVKVPPPNLHIPAEQVAQVRLVPACGEICFRGRIRETPTESLDRAGISIAGLACTIDRNSREHDQQTRALKARRNLQLCDLAIKEDGPQARWLNCQAEAHANLDNRTEAAKLYREGIKASERGSTDMLEAYYGLLTALDGIPDATTAQISVCVEALEIFPTDAQLLCAMGGYLQKQGRTDLATRSYETAYRFGQIDPQAWHLQEIAPFVAVCYSVALQLSNRDEEALQVLTDALERHPDSMRLRRQLLESDIKHGRTDQALAQLDSWPVQPPDVEALRAAVRGACLASQKNWAVARSYLKTAHSAGCRDIVCLRWLAIALLSLGDVGEAEKILRDWSEIDPANIEPKRYLAAIERARAPASSHGGHANAGGHQHTGPSVFNRPTIAPTENR